MENRPELGSSLGDMECLTVKRCFRVTDNSKMDGGKNGYKVLAIRNF